MIRNDPGVIEDEELVADRRSSAHHHCEHQRQHQDMQDRLEQRPAVAELGFPEPGAGFANDQGVNDTRLSVQRRENGGPRPRLSPRPQWALAQYNVIAVEGLEPAVQYLQDGLGVFFIVGRGPDQFAADWNESKHSQLLAGLAPPPQREDAVDRPAHPARARAERVPAHREVGDEGQVQEHEARDEVRAHRDEVPDDGRADLRIEEQVERSIRPAEVDDRVDRADEERRDRGRLGETGQRRAPLRVRQAEDRARHRPAVADPDEEDAVDDVEAPRDLLVEAGDPEAALQLIDVRVEPRGDHR